MNTTADKKSSAASVPKTKGINTKQDIRDWAEYSQAIASAMSKRMSELGLTQQMLAEKMNCTQQYISRVLKGQKICRWKLYVRLKTHWASRLLKVWMKTGNKTGI